MTRVAFAGIFSASLEPRVRAHLHAPCEIVVGDEAGIVASLADVDVLVSMAFTRAMAAAAPRLRLVQVPGAGLDRIDRAALAAGTWLANAYGHEVGIAEWALGAMLALAREYARLDAALRRGTWLSQWAVGPPAPPVWPELAGKTLGIVGYGRIGRALARRARAFDMRILAVRQDVGASAGDDLDRLGGPEILDDVLRGADHLVVALPLTERTRGLLGGRELALMKPTAVLVNVGRADVIAPAALYAALAAGRLGGAALDVWYRYPSDDTPTLPAMQPFHELPNVLMSPHVSGWTEGMLEARARLVADNIARAERGEPPLNRIPASA